MKKYTVLSLALLASLFGSPLFAGLASLVDGMRLGRSVARPFVPAAVNSFAAKMLIDSFAAGKINADFAREYPHAYKYISDELVSAGLDPASIRIINHKEEINFNFKSAGEIASHFLSGEDREPVFVRMLWCAGSFCCIGDKGLLVSLVEFEKELSLANTTDVESDILKVMKVSFAHEISHLRHRDGCGMAGFVSGSLAGTLAEVVGAYFFDAGASLLSSAVRFVATGLLYSCLDDRLCYTREFHADEEAIERFSSQPSYLIAQAKLYALLHHYVTTDDTIYPSALSRAVRFAAAAGKSVTEAILSERLKTATAEEILSGAIFE